ncbi:MAG: lysophospholipid acyltransferase family protein [Pyrinomonadaceae bacterium]
MVRNSKLPDRPPSTIAVAIARKLSMLLGKVFFRLEHFNLSNVPPETGEGLIIVSNHQTYFDPFLICAPIDRRIRFMAWDEVFKNRFSDGLLRMLGAFPVSLKKGGTIRAMITSMTLLKNGETLMIFPEGSREFPDGKHLPFKTGAARIALESKVAILPVTVKGGNRVWPQGRKLPRPGRIEIYYHPLFYPEAGESGVDSAQKVTEKLRTIIASV